jgi:ribosome biogenesis GTPase
MSARLAAVIRKANLEQFALPGGRLLIDTPGMHELQLWETDGSFDASFRDVEQLAVRCRFPDCRHDREPGCTVQEALADGSLDRGRYQSYVKLQRELAYFNRKENKTLQAADKNKWKKIRQAVKQRSRL